jgi:hypothetical protein
VLDDSREAWKNKAHSGERKSIVPIVTFYMCTYGRTVVHEDKHESEAESFGTLCFDFQVADFRVVVAQGSLQREGRASSATSPGISLLLCCFTPPDLCP